MKVFIVGYYGGKNLGDELLLYKISNDINSLFPDSSFFVWSTDKEFTEDLVREPAFCAVDRFSADETADAVRESDIVVYGGGGLVNEHFGLNVKDLFVDFGKHVASYAVPALMAKIYKKPVFYWGLGHGPVVSKEGKLFSKWFYSLADRVVLRDDYSFHAVKSLLNDREENVFLDIDPLLALDFASLVGKKRYNNVLGVSIREGFNDSGVLNSLPQALKRIADINREIRFMFIPCDLNRDVALINDLKRATADIGIEEDRIVEVSVETVFDVIDAIYQCDWFLGMRLHSLVAAYKLGVPFSAISYDIKTEEFIKKFDMPSIKATSLSVNSVFILLSKLVQKGRRKEKKEYSYKAPQIFEEFVEGNDVCGNWDMVEETKRKEEDRELQYADDYINTLVFQRDTFRRGYLNEISKTRVLKEENKKLRSSFENCKSKLVEAENALKGKEIELASCMQRSEELKKVLDEIYSSNFWKLAQKYYKMRENSFLRCLYPYYRPLLGFLFRRKNIKVTVDIDKNMERKETEENVQQVDAMHQKKERIERFLAEAEDLVIMFSSLPFKELLNQRPMNLSKGFSKEGYHVLFVVWQWSENDRLENEFEEVYQRILQVPMYGFFELIESLDWLRFNKKFLYHTFPEKGLIFLSHQFRQNGFGIIYDIVDDWEGFFDVDQAIWYEKAFEEQIILESDFVYAVNRYLVKKFQFLRTDIECISNGLDIDSIGRDAMFIASSKCSKPTIGYIGWLDEGRFDWDFLFNFAESFTNINIELIGYGMSDGIRKKVEKYPHINYIGKVVPPRLKEFVSGWCMGMIPFREDDISFGSDPLKVYQYIYFGLPTLVKGCLEVKNYPMVFTVLNGDDVERFVRNFDSKEKVVNFREEKKKEIIEFIENNTWDNKIKKILSIIQGRTFWQ